MCLFWILVLVSDICLGVGLLDHMTTLLLVFWGTLHSICLSGCTNLYSHQQFRKAHFCLHPLQCWIILNSIILSSQANSAILFGLSWHLNTGYSSDYRKTPLPRKSRSPKKWSPKFLKLTFNLLQKGNVRDMTGLLWELKNTTFIHSFICSFKDYFSCVFSASSTVLVLGK